MTRTTSIEAYQDLKESGALNSLQDQIYTYLFEHGPLTQTEIGAFCLTTARPQSISPRFAELKNLGLIIDTGKRKCSVTGRTVLQWDVVYNETEVAV